MDTWRLIITKKQKEIKIFDFTKGLRILILLTIILLAGQIALEVLTPQYVKNIINILSDNNSDLSSQKKESEIWFNGGLLLLFVIVIICISLTIQTLLIPKITTQFTMNLKNKVFAKIQELSPQDLSKLSIGAILNRLNADVLSLERTLSMLILNVIRSIFVFGSALFFSITTSPQLSLIFVITIPIIVVMVFVVSYVQKIIKRLFIFNDEFNQKLQENLNSLKTIKANATEEKEYSIIQKLTQKLTKSNLKITVANSVSESFFMMIIFMSLIILATIGVNQVLQNKIQIGTMVLFSTYIWMITFSFIGILNIGFNLFIAKPSAQRIKEILNYQSLIKNSLNPIKDFSIDVIEFKNVSFKHENSDLLVLKNINFVIKKNQTLGILGQTGEGKSTIINLLARFFDVTSGEILINNINIKEYDINKLREKISIVFQDSVLFKGTIRSNLTSFNKNIDDQEIYNALEKSDIYNFVNGLEDKLNHKVEPKGTNFSGGQKQRLSIARALLKQPELLILDDATSAVDATTEKKIKTAINETLGMTKIIISQKISSIKDCDFIAVIEKGKLSALSSHEQLLKTNKTYKNIFESQNSMIEVTNE
ncbi:ABC transporter ATP-binding protein [Mycoplasmopsis edwardii]|nr:ABC transporter ATP-binding protein [Mycoplasmopsis edwardii]